MNSSDQIADAILEIRNLLRLIAEPQIAARDQKLREELKSLVGKSIPKAQSIFLMDGNHSQASIHKQTGVNQGHLSTLIKNLSKSQLIVGDTKLPKLAISIPPNFFDT